MNEEQMNEYCYQINLASCLISSFRNFIEVKNYFLNT